MLAAADVVPLVLERERLAFLGLLELGLPLRDLGEPLLALRGVDGPALLGPGPHVGHGALDESFRVERDEQLGRDRQRRRAEVARRPDRLIVQRAGSVSRDALDGFADLLLEL